MNAVQRARRSSASDEAEPDGTRRRSSSRAAIVATFVAIACGGAWLVAIPLWSSDLGLSSPIAGLLLPVMMYTPALAVLVVLTLQRVRPGAAVRMLGMWPLRPFRRTIGLSLLGIVGTAFVIVVGVAIAAGLGFVRLDLQHFSGFTAMIRATAGTSVDEVPVSLLVAVQLAAIPFAALVNGVLAFGEEIGWRGWLLPALRPLGTGPALVLSGAIWGIWHSPLLLLGYDFDQPNLLGVLLMVVACSVIGVLFGWLRLRSGSLWPPVLAHGALNACAGMVYLFAADGQTPDLVLAGPLGVGTWIAGGAVIAVLVVARQFDGVGTTKKRKRS